MNYEMLNAHHEASKVRVALAIQNRVGGQKKPLT